MSDAISFDPTIFKNAERARRAAAALMHYDEPDGTPTPLCDFLADCMHLAHREGVDFREQLRRAERRFHAEAGDEATELTPAIDTKRTNLMSDETISLDPTVRNAERAQRATAVLLYHSRLVGDESCDDLDWVNFVDLLADLMHLAQSKGLDFQEMLRIAGYHFTAEINGEP